MRSSGIRGILLFLATAMAALVAAPAAVAAVARGDFNGDGAADLAVGAPGEDLGTLTDAGAVNVIYGSAGGLTAAGNQLLSQAPDSVLGTVGKFDQFGYALAAGDLDGDGFSDLAIGVPKDRVQGVSAGAVNVL